VAGQYLAHGAGLKNRVWKRQLFISFSLKKNSKSKHLSFICFQKCRSFRGHHDRFSWGGFTRSTLGSATALLFCAKIQNDHLSKYVSQQKPNLSKIVRNNCVFQVKDLAKRQCNMAPSTSNQHRLDFEDNRTASTTPTLQLVSLAKSLVSR